MTFILHVIQLSGKGVQVATPVSTAEPFWLPRRHVDWAEPPEPGAKIAAKIPKWLAAKHQQLVRLRGQYALPLTPEPKLIPAIADKEGSFPMTDSNELRGALFRETTKKSEKGPDMTGHLTIGGVRYRLAGWTREGRDGRKFLSLAAEPPKDQQQRPQEPQGNAYATARGRDEPQRQPAGGPTFGESDIPFGPCR